MDEATARAATQRLRRSCVQMKELDAAWELLEVLCASRLRSNAFHLGAMCGAFAQSNAWRLAFGAVQRMETRTVPVDLIASNAALHSLEPRSGASLWRRSLEAARQAELQELTDEISSNCCINHCAKGAQWQRSMQLLLSCLWRRMCVDTFGCSSAIDGLSADGWQRAWSLLRQMPRWNLMPDEFSLASAAQCLSGQWRRALAAGLASSLHRLRRSEVMYGSMIQSCELASLWRRAFALGSGCSVIGMSTALTAGAQAAQWLASLHGFSQMSSGSIQLDEISCGATISACEKGQTWAMALELLSDAFTKQFAQHIVTWNSAVSSCERFSLWFSCLALLSSAKDAGRQADAISRASVASACGKGGRWRWALQEADLSSEAGARAVEQMQNFVSWELFGDKLATWTFRGNVQPLALRAVDIYGPLALLLGCCVVEVFLRGELTMDDSSSLPELVQEKLRDGLALLFAPLREFVQNFMQGKAGFWELSPKDRAKMEALGQAILPPTRGGERRSSFAA
ncbi:unnamed protein product [Durusdinium trenchii]|uniref:Nuclear pore complex protein Nup85 n=1 Tax=Durusdinium trenchii TaxID=1381693 RepID=A0ABP0MN06_9DINO